MDSNGISARAHGLPACLTPCSQNELYHLVDARILFDRREDGWAAIAHLRRIPLHHFQRSPDVFRDVDLIYWLVRRERFSEAA